ncbi:MAG: hypothetical protein H6737_31420 [Alphaproteobacteria bacterium]|nr:hypothetical protein [Alphaproteobacteria bacterium]
MPLPADFDQQCMYTEDAWFLTDWRAEPEAQRIVGLCDTTRLGPLVDAQRPWPGHPKHLPGAVVIQITGTLGQLFAAYLLDMPATEGWVGFGTHIHSARFRRIGEIGPPVECTATLLAKRTLRDTVFTRFGFLFTQSGLEVYRSEQTAAWVQSGHRGPLT